MNNDIFGELKKLANPSVSNSTPSELVVDGNKISNPTEILSAFSTHFFPANSPDDKLHKSVIDETNSFCDIPLPTDEVYVSLSDVEQAFDSMRLTKSPGPDGISPDWLKLSFNLVKAHLLALFAVCFKLSYFPKHWKIASIIILKKNNKDNYLHPNCFRPISILNAVSKLFEKIILAKLKRLASTHNWFSPSQHGFRAGLSTESAALTLVKLIENNKKQKSQRAVHS